MKKRTPQLKLPGKLNPQLRWLADRPIELELTGAAKEHIAREGYNPLYDPRPLKRFLQRHVETALSCKLLVGEISHHRRMRGRGLPRGRNDERRDLYVVVRAQLPHQLTDEEHELWKSSVASLDSNRANHEIFNREVRL